MGQPDKDANNDDKKAPKLDAILPDDLPPAAAELVGDIDNYQKKMEREWEKAKTGYEQKINSIMEEFLRTTPSTEPKETAEPEPTPKVPPPSRDTRLSRLMSQMEDELNEASRKIKHPPFLSSSAPETMQLPWNGPLSFWTKKRKLLLAAALLIIVGGIFGFVQYSVVVTPLPYARTLGPVVRNNKIYIMDWFRKALYVHADRFDLPIRSVEPVQNNLATGFAFSDKTLWTLDSLDKKILLHTVTPEHQVTSVVDSPASRPTGLFYDGTDLWSADQDTKELYRHRGNDLEEIRDTFQLPDMTITALAFRNNRLWILDGKSRLVNVYRLQKPLLQLGSFDLDPFVKGAAPTGMAFVKGRIYLVTENPATLTRIPIFRLKQSKTEAF